MNLIPCPACKNEVAETAQFCPNCGFEVKKYLKKMDKPKRAIAHTKRNCIVTAIIALVLSIACAFFGAFPVMSYINSAENAYSHEMELYEIYAKIWMKTSNDDFVNSLFGEDSYLSHMTSEEAYQAWLQSSRNLKEYRNNIKFWEIVQVVCFVLIAVFMVLAAIRIWLLMRKKRNFLKTTEIQI